MSKSNITFMSMDKGLKSASRYIKSTGEKKNATIVLITDIRHSTWSDMKIIL